MGKRPIIIYGAGGFGREIACLINAINEERAEPQWDLLGFVDDNAVVGTKLRHGEVLGNADYINNYSSGEVVVAIAVGSANALKAIRLKITNRKAWFPTLIAPDVKFFDIGSVKIGEGNLITFGCRLSCDVKIGNFNVINGCISMGHDVKVGDFNVLMPETRISGETCVGNGNFFGARSFVAQRLKIGDFTKIAAGSIVLRSTKDGELYMGNPAQRIRI